MSPTINFSASRNVILRLCFLTIAVIAFSALSSLSAEGQVSNDSQFVPDRSAIDRILNSDIRQSQPAATQPRYDDQVVPSVYENSPKSVPLQDAWSTSDVQTIGNLRISDLEHNEARPNFVEREKAVTDNAEPPTSRSEKQNMGQLVSKIGMNLAFVLFVGTGFVVLAKQWINPKAETKSGKLPTGKLHVKEVLKLDGKSTLRVVQWKDAHVLIASDAQGIRAVVALTPTFSETLDEVAAEMTDCDVEAPMQQRSSPTQTSQPSRTSARESGPNKFEKAATHPGEIDDRLIQMLLNSAKGTSPSITNSGKG